MNFTELQDRLKFVLNHNDNQTDQDLTTARIKQLLNSAYTAEVRLGKKEGSKSHFIATRELTWPVSTVTLAVPSWMQGQELVQLRDVTNDTIGVQVYFSEYGTNGDVFFKDRGTMQWGLTGPASAKTIRVIYEQTAEALVEDDDEPTLIPADMHDLIVWSAACDARIILEDAAPPSWQQKLLQYQVDYWKYLSRGRPHSDGPRLPGHDDGDERLLLY